MIVFLLVNQITVRYLTLIVNPRTVKGRVRVQEDGDVDVYEKEKTILK
jgi:hypothetical protein